MSLNWTYIINDKNKPKFAINYFSILLLDLHDYIWHYLNPVKLFYSWIDFWNIK